MRQMAKCQTIMFRWSQCIYWCLPCWLSFWRWCIHWFRSMFYQMHTTVDISTITCDRTLLWPPESDCIIRLFLYYKRLFYTFWQLKWHAACWRFMWWRYGTGSLTRTIKTTAGCNHLMSDSIFCQIVDKIVHKKWHVSSQNQHDCVHSHNLCSLVWSLEGFLDITSYSVNQSTNQSINHSINQSIN